MEENKRIYDHEELHDLINRDHTCIISKICNRKIELEAKYLKDIKSGIKEALNKGLNKFDYSLNGILLDYRNLNVVADEWSGRIVGRLGEFIVTIRAEFIIFDPRVGNLLEGVVNAKSNTHVGCLVHKRFNAVILKADNDDNWNCSCINIGDKIIFSIVDHVFCGHIPHIEGVFIKQCNDERNSDQIHKASENGDNSDESNVFTEKKKHKKKSKKKHELDTSNLSLKKKPEEDLTDILEMKMEKSNLKKNENTKISHDNLANTDDLLFDIESKKKKHKKKNKINIDAENENNSLKPDSLQQNSKLVLGVNDMEANDGQLKKQKKKRSRKKDEEQTNEVTTNECKESFEMAHTDKKKKSKSTKEKNEQNLESDTPKKKKKKKDKEKGLENIQEAFRKLSKKKKLDEEHLTEEKVEEKDVSQCFKMTEKNISPSKKNKVNVDDPSEIRISSTDLIDQLMKIVPTDLILRNETTPKKGTGLENVKTPKHLALNEDNKKEIPSKDLPSSKKRRKESLLGISSNSNLAEGGLEITPSKKRRLEESLTSSELIKPQEKSLFSDSEDSPSSGKMLKNPAALDAGTTLLKPGTENKESEGDNVPTSSDKKKKVHVKEKKTKKQNSESGKKKLTEYLLTSEEKKKTDNPAIKSPVNDENKGDSENKSCSIKGGAVPPPKVQTKMTLLERFEICLAKPVDGKSDKSDKNEKDVNSLKLVDQTTTPVNQNKSLKNVETETKVNKSADILGETAQPKMIQPKNSPLVAATDVTVFNNPLTTSTPKDSPRKIEKQKSKNAKKPKKSESKMNVADRERELMIDKLMKDAKSILNLPF